jgi:hypothetical protein
VRRFPVLLASATCSLLVLTAATASGTVSNSGPLTGSFTVGLSGAQEVPPADRDGSGTAQVRLVVQDNKVCYALRVDDIAPATAAHIHQAVAGSNGPIVVDFIAPNPRTSAACTSPRPTAPSDTVQNIINHPEQYYVNVHNAQFPGGAIRGQLG